MRHFALICLSAALLLPASCCQTAGTVAPEKVAPPDHESAFAGWESTAPAESAAPQEGPAAPTADEMEALRKANRKLAATVEKLMGEVEKMKAEAAKPPALATEAPAPVEAPARAALTAGVLRRLLLAAGVADLQVGTDREGRVVVTMPASASFPSGKATLTRGARARLGILASILVREAPGIRVRAEGHTDSDPIRKSAWKSNQELSEARARAVAEYLVAKGGLSPERVESAGFGDTRPVASNRTREGKARNRRVEIVLVP